MVAELGFKPTLCLQTVLSIILLHGSERWQLLIFLVNILPDITVFHFLEMHSSSPPLSLSHTEKGKKVLHKCYIKFA